MAVDITVPDLGESVSEAIIANWYKAEGEAVTKDEPVCELETDKVTVEVNAPDSGVLSKIAAQVDDTVEVGALLGSIDTDAKAGDVAAPKKETPTESTGSSDVKKTDGESDDRGPKKSVPSSNPSSASSPSTAQAADLSRNPPSVRRIASEQNIDLSKTAASGKDGRHTKGDMMNPKATGGESSAPAARGDKPEERVKMTKLRQAIARRLKESQNTAAILTTFNEVDMTAAKQLRVDYKDLFEKKFGQRLGFMGLFVKASVQALKEIPAVNAHIEGDEVIYKHYYDIGVAVSTESGLVVPVVRDCEHLNLAGIESEIIRLAGKARDGQLSMADMTGGTFTITNGGVFGSLMATPIINPPQSGILGMHKIEDRPIALNGEVVIRPMMYIALSYDHRIIDGRESVTFLKRVKELIEDPARLILEI